MELVIFCIGVPSAGGMMWGGGGGGSVLGVWGMLLW